MYKGYPQLIQLQLHTELFSKDFFSLFRTKAIDLLVEVVVTNADRQVDNSAGSDKQFSLKKYTCKSGCKLFPVYQFASLFLCTSISLDCKNMSSLSS